MLWTKHAQRYFRYRCTPVPADRAKPFVNALRTPLFRSQVSACDMIDVSPPHSIGLRKCSISITAFAQAVICEGNARHRTAVELSRIVYREAAAHEQIIIDLNIGDRPKEVVDHDCRHLAPGIDDRVVRY